MEWKGLSKKVHLTHVDQFELQPFLFATFLHGLFLLVFVQLDEGWSTRVTFKFHLVGFVLVHGELVVDLEHLRLDQVVARLGQHRGRLL